jgi:hypothetical protein
MAKGQECRVRPIRALLACKLLSAKSLQQSQFGYLVTSAGSSRLGEHLDSTVQRHQSAFNLELRMALSHLPLERADRGAMSIGLELGIGDLVRAVGDLRRSAVPVIDRDDLFDFVQLD